MANSARILVIAVLLLFSEFVKMGISVELRCYCNLPACVHTAYMCKSNIGCFQELELNPKTGSDSPRIGCLELWSKEKPFRCLQLGTHTINSEPPITTTTPKSPTLANKHKKKAFLRCCLEDMCNYVPMDSNADLGVFRDQNEKVSISVEGSSHGESPIDKSQVPISDRLWFRIAVIAVPIFGGLILLVLIILASALLRADWRKVSDNDRLLAGACGESERCISPTVLPTVKCEKLLYQPKPFPGYLRGQLRHYHSDTTLVVCSEKAKERPNTVLFNGN